MHRSAVEVRLRTFDIKFKPEEVNNMFAITKTKNEMTFHDFFFILMGTPVYSERACLHEWLLVSNSREFLKRIVEPIKTEGQFDMSKASVPNVTNATSQSEIYAAKLVMEQFLEPGKYKEKQVRDLVILPGEVLNLQEVTP